MVRYDDAPPREALRVATQGGAVKASARRRATLRLRFDAPAPQKADQRKAYSQ
jgi:hypothetical protein